MSHGSSKYSCAAKTLRLQRACIFDEYSPSNMQHETFTPPRNGDVDQGWAILAICWAFIACALISTVLRVWVRSRITRNLGGDDYFAVAAMVRARIHGVKKSLFLAHLR